MIVSLSGILTDKDAAQAVIECRGIGFGVAMSRAGLMALGPVGAEVTVLVHTHIGQDAARLFGFVQAQERQTFEVLIGTPGVGPKLALTILSTLTPDELQAAVDAGDKIGLTRIAGVGSKKAERLLLDLRGRLAKGAPTVALGGALFADLHSALLNVGFAPEVAHTAARRALEQAPSETCLTTLLREALRATTRC